MKKKISIILSFVIILTTLFCTTIYANDIKVYIDNEVVELTDANGERVYPFIQNGTTYMPLRGVSEILDCDVVWDGDNQTIRIYEKGQYREETFHNDDSKIKVYFNSELVEFKTANGSVVNPFIDNGTTYVPLRGISETLGCQVDWDGENFAVLIWDKVVPPDGTPLYYLQPYDSHGVSFYYDVDGNPLDICGENYTNAICPWAYMSNTEAMFNINGKYKYLTFTIGHSGGDFDQDKKVTFIVDGHIVEIYKLSANSSPQDVKIPLNNGLNLTILFNDHRVALGNVRFM